jgi:exodeoxyribonuclease VII small subunit
VTDVHDSGDRVSPSNSVGQTSVPPNSIGDSWNYEQTVEQVEATIAKIESGDLDLAQVFDEFAAAVKHLQACEAFLADRQRQMDILIESLKDEPEF